MLGLLTFFVLQAISASHVWAATGDIVPGAYIIKFHHNGGSSNTHDHTAQVDDSVHTAFEQYMGSNKIDFATRFKFSDKTLFYGQSVTLENEHDVQALHAFDNTAAVYPVRRVKMHSHRPMHHHRHRAVPFGKRDDAPNSVGGTAAGNDTFSPHAMTGIDQLHASGMFGKGIKVGVMDSGVDYTHDALNGNIGYNQSCYGQPGCPIAGGRSFTDDAGNQVQSDDLRPHCPHDDFEFGHGTHTTGTIVASPRDRNCPGVVPQASAYHYRVFGCGGNGGRTDDMMAAAQQAGHDGMDVLSISIGGPILWSEADPMTEMFNSLVRKGMSIAVSTGNDGDKGLWYASTPAAADDVVAVGAVANVLLSGFTADVASSGGDTKSLVYQTGNAFAFNGTTKFPVYAVSKTLNIEDDACDELPDDTPDLSGHVALIGRGGCGMNVKAQNAAKKGAQYVLIYNVPGRSPGTSDGNFWPLPRSAGLTFEDGAAILDMLSKGDVTIDFSNSKAVTYQDKGTGGATTDFTQYAITMELKMGVSVTGVGAFIDSTWVDQSPNYVILQGTSMSCPQVAGALALYKSIKGPGEDPYQIRSVMVSTATPAVYNNTLQVIDSVARQGGGLINVPKAVNTPTRVWPDRLELNDTQFFNGTQTITVTNIGKDEQQFKLAHLPAGTVYTFDDSNKNIINTGYIIPYNKDQAQVSFDPASFSVAAGQSQSVTVKIQHPNDAQGTLPVYSGYVQLQSSADIGSVNVPYIGVAGAMSKVPIFNATTNEDGNQLPVLVGANQTVIKDDNQVFTLADSDNSPSLQWQVVLGSKLVYIDLVNANTTFVPTNTGTTTASAQQSQPKVRSTTQCARASSGSSSASASTLPDSDIVAPLSKFEFDAHAGDFTPDVFTVSSPYTDQDGKNQTIPDGTYRLAIRALRLFTLPDAPNAFESYLSPAFTVKKA
ncbi:hypothetical protein OC842_005999 [Tilletia horrida]|uniref:Peptidase S8/S53 domain-containing protein n=1 Tax=Tilletia horrida TaxID=155126 RepID=A0AAN6G6Q0_9BASI|nr:hypothetical protein OC842_005999 [Tilletia horrida]